MLFFSLNKNSHFWLRFDFTIDISLTLGYFFVFFLFIRDFHVISIQKILLNNTMNKIKAGLNSLPFFLTYSHIHTHTHLFTQLLCHRQYVTQGQFLSRRNLFWIQKFPSPKLVALSRLWFWLLDYSVRIKHVWFNWFIHVKIDLKKMKC